MPKGVTREDLDNLDVYKRDVINKNRKEHPGEVVSKKTYPRPSSNRKRHSGVPGASR